MYVVIGDVTVLAFSQIWHIFPDGRENKLDNSI